MSFTITDYHWRRIRSRAHRLQLAVRTRGWKGALSRALAAPEPDTGAGCPPPTAAAATRHPAGCRVLVVDSSTPRPDRDSGSVRAMHLVRALVELGHAVDFLPDDRRHAGHYTQALEAAGARSLHAAPSYPRALAQSAYDVVIVSRYHLAHFLFPLLRRRMPGARLVLDTVDLHHVREQREAAFRGDAALERLAATTRRFELDCIRQADATWVVSPVESAMLAASCKGSRVFVVPNILVPDPAPPGLPSRRDLLFVGGGQHPPNLDAARWLVEDILPRVHRHLPECRLHLVGAGLDAALGRGDGVVVHGHVPDLSPLLRGSLIGVAPLRFGAGVKGKVNQYMASGMAVVSTGCGAEGMHLVDGRDVLLRDDAGGFASAVVELHRDPALWTAIAQAGHASVQRHFSVALAKQRVTDTFNAILS